LAALVNTAHGEAASKIKQLDQHYIAHKIAHAVAGCAAAAANKGKCQDGAIGAAVGEIVGEALVNGKNPAALTAKEREQILAYSKLVAGTVSGVAGGDVNAAANAAAVAVENNALNNLEIIEIGKRVDKECNQGNNAECRNRIIAEAVNKSDQRSKLAKQDIVDINAVQNKYAAEAFAICKGNTACATFVGNRFTYARLHCESSGCMANIAQSIIREASSRYGSVWDTVSRVFNDFSPVLLSTKAVPFNFGSKQLLLEHFKKHGSEFGVKTANDYLKIGRDVMQKGSRVKYEYRGEIRTGYVQFLGNSKSGEAKFAFVGTNNQGAITTIHVEKGKNLWKTLNGNSTDKIIYER
ncbi:VENN motif pre-toxin domain-containing protein, partial [Neisseria sp. N95_16]